MTNFRFIDLFAGIGGMRLGFEAAGGECVFTSEWNPKSQATYRANFGDDDIAGDITEIEALRICSVKPKSLEKEDFLVME